MKIIKFIITGCGGIGKSFFSPLANWKSIVYYRHISCMTGGSRKTAGEYSGVSRPPGQPE
jgi:hypothetical protein